MAYLLAGVLYATITPRWQAPDEPAHYNYVRYLATQRRFPELVAGCYNQAYLAQLTAERFPPNLPIDSVCYEYHQPPLYYLLVTPLFILTGGSLLALRLASVALGAGVVALAFAVARAVFPRQPDIALGTMAFVAFVPMHAAMLAAVNNDALAELLLAAMLLLLVRRITAAAPPARRDNLLLGVTLGLGLITKTTIYIAVPLVAVALLLPALTQKATGRQALTQAAIIFGLALLIALPWYGRNAAVYGGFDILGLGRHNAVVVGQLRTTDFLAGVGATAYAGNFLFTTFHSFWGQFGWMAVPMDARTYRLLAALLAVAGFGLAASAAQRRWAQLEAGQPQALGLLALAAGLVALAYGGYNLGFVQFQGRYLFPALIPLGLFFALGWREALRPHRTWWLVAGLAVALGGVVAADGLDKWGGLMVLLFMAAAAARNIIPRAEPYLTPALLAAGYLALAALALVSPYWFIAPYL